MCFELRNGVVWIASTLLASSILGMIGMIFNSVILGGVDVLGWRGYAIFSLILAIPMNIIGIVGAVKRRKKFVYAYFLYSIVLAFMHTVSQIAWWVQMGQGKLKQPIVAECERVLVHQGYSMLEAQQECGHITNIQLGIITAGMFVGLVIQLYWTYVIRRLYLRILIENAGHGMPFSNYTQV